VCMGSQTVSSTRSCTVTLRRTSYRAPRPAWLKRPWLTLARTKRCASRLYQLHRPVAVCLDRHGQRTGYLPGDALGRFPGAALAVIDAKIVVEARVYHFVQAERHDRRAGANITDQHEQATR